MSKGYEGFILLVPENKGWRGSSDLIRGNFLFADEENLSINQDITERPGKITYGRSLKASNRVIGKQTPGGDMTFQFRSDDLPIICLGHFQKFIGTQYSGTLIGSAQYTFVPEKGIPNYSGSAYGTGAYTGAKGDTFTFGVVKKYFDTAENGGSNAVWFKSCIVDELMFSCAAGDDAKCKASIRAASMDTGTPIGSLFNPNSSLGSYSTNSSFQWWSATLTYGGGTLDVTKFEWTSKNNLEEYMALGSKNPSKYRYGRYDISGSFDLDFPYDGLKHFATMIGGSAFAVVATLYNGTSDWCSFSFPNCRLKSTEANMKGGDQETAFSLPFTAYESENGSTAPVTVTVHTTTYGSTPVTRL